METGFRDRKKYRDRQKLLVLLSDLKWAYIGGLIRTGVPYMLYFLYKIINPKTRNGDSNLNYEIEKAELHKF